ncbi:hypothetical protein CWS02_17855 [Enterobacter sp. EA-1]|nr:hypothetical protein CWS02_17855 [Enterobacter sp. EA-1]
MIHWFELDTSGLIKILIKNLKGLLKEMRVENSPHVLRLEGMGLLLNPIALNVAEDPDLERRASISAAFFAPKVYVRAALKSHMNRESGIYVLHQYAYMP